MSEKISKTQFNEIATVLLVDDDELILKAIARELRDQYEILKATSQTELIYSFHQTPTYSDNFQT